MLSERSQHRSLVYMGIASIDSHLLKSTLHPCFLFVCFCPINLCPFFAEVGVSLIFYLSSNNGPMITFTPNLRRAARNMMPRGCAVQGLCPRDRAFHLPTAGSKNYQKTSTAVPGPRVEFGAAKALSPVPPAFLWKGEHQYFEMGICKL